MLAVDHTFDKNYFFYISLKSSLDIYLHFDGLIQDCSNSNVLAME